MKNFITLFALLLLGLNTYAQGEYNDLKILYADEKYEKLVGEAEKYTEKESTKYDPVPYIWAARALYKISLTGTTDERFKNAYKDAITFLSKGMKYDIKKNDGQAMIEFSEFIDEFKMSLYNRISNDIGAGDFKKGYAWCVKYQKISDKFAGVNYVIGACKHQDGDKSTARAKWTEGEQALTEVTGIDEWSEADRKMLKLGILQTAKAFKESQQMDKARETLNKAAQWFEEDEDWKVQYDEIVNG